MLMPITTTATELQRNYRKVVDKAKKAKDAIVVMSNNTPEAVYIDYETYVSKFVANELYSRKKAKEDLLSLAGTMSSKEVDKLNNDIDEMNEIVFSEDWQ